MEHPCIPISRQCGLIDLNRSSLYYKPHPVSEYNLDLMKLIDRQYTKTPFYGVPRMTDWLNDQGYPVNHKRIARLMGIMGIQAIYPKKRLSIPDKEHTVYPYLLKGLAITQPDQVWTSDITYIPMRTGIHGMCSPGGYPLSSMPPRLSIRPLPFTSTDFTNILLDHRVRISMDGRGRVFDNIFIERLWRTVKYEEVYIKDYVNVWEGIRSLNTYLRFYNDERIHTAIGHAAPSSVYYGNSRKGICA